MRLRSAITLCLWAACGAAFADQTPCPSTAGADTHPAFDATRETLIRIEP